MKTIKRIDLLFLYLLFVIGAVFAEDVTLQWDANTESDLAGYYLDYDIVTHCDNNEDECTNPNSGYSGTGADQGDSPITILETAENPEITITGLDSSQKYFFSVRAFDTENLVSGQSNQVYLDKSITPPTVVLQDATVIWNANSETDLAGYKFYYKETSGGAPYNGTGMTVLGEVSDSPVDIPLTTSGFDPENPSISLIFDSCKTWYIVVTAYDNDGLESNYSEEVSITDGCPPNAPTGVSIEYTSN